MHTLTAYSTVFMMCIACPLLSFAQEAPYKLTVGYYRMTGDDVANARGVDVNVRHSSDFGNAWLGWYQQPAMDNDPETKLKQWRTGWDDSFNLSFVKLQPSVQAASGGFLGGSLSVETGEAVHPNWFAGAGLGRTNLRPYVNLNFDPNDALMATGGYRWSKQQALSVQWVRDNRLNPDQRHLHLIYRVGSSQTQRLTFDLLSKTGKVTDNADTTTKINKLGLSMTYDWREHFVRVAYDPKVNFTNQDMVRVSVGTRF